MHAHQVLPAGGSVFVELACQRLSPHEGMGLALKLWHAALCALRQRPEGGAPAGAVGTEEAALLSRRRRCRGRRS